MKKIKINDTNAYLNSLIPFKGYIAMNLFGLIFWRKDCENFINNPYYTNYVRATVNHETIHKEQIKDFAIPLSFFEPLQILVGSLFFYPFYFMNWLFNIFTSPKKAYKNICFEREAYNHEYDFEYLKHRKHFQFLKEKRKK